MGTGNKLKQLLKEKKMTVAELSRKTKISAQTLYSIINRDSSISYENLLLLSKALEIDIIELSDFKKYQQDVIANRPGLSVMQKKWNDKNRPEHEMFLEFANNAIIESLDITEDKQELLYNYNQLNEMGKEEALKRVSELTEIPKYSIANLMSGMRGLDLPEGDTTVTFEMVTDNNKKEE